MPAYELNTLFDSLPAPVLVTSVDLPDCTVLDANQAFLRLTGLPKEQLLGQGFGNVSSVLAGREPGEWKDALQKVCASGDVQALSTVQLGAAGSGSRLYDITLSPVPGETKQVAYILHTFTDVTAIARARQAEELVQTINGIVWEADAKTFDFTFVSDQVENILGFTAGEWLSEPDFWKNHMHPDDRAGIPEFCPAVQSGVTNHRFDYRMIRASGEVIWIRDLVTIVRQNGEPCLLRGFMVDITDTKRLEDLEHLEKEVIALNAAQKPPLSEVLNKYLIGLERIFPDMKCSVLGISNNRLQNWSAPSLPAAYTSAIEKLEIGENAGSCGTAAFLKQNVIVSDIATDIRWAGHKHLALPHQLLACASYPIILTDGTVIATFAVYYDKPRVPHEEEFKVIARSVALLSVILENRHNAELLAETSLLISQGQELARFGSWQWDMESNVVSWSDTLYTIYGVDRESYVPSLEGYLQRVHPADEQRVRDGLLHALETRGEIEFEERIVHSSGQIRYLKTWGKTTVDEHNHVVKMIGACLDITESKKIQEDLQTSESRLRSLVDAQTNYVIRTDLLGNYTYYNNRYQEDFRWFYNDENFIGVNCIMIVRHYHRLNAVDTVRQCLRNPGAVFTVELDLVQLSDKPRTVYWHFLALTDSQGQVTEIQCIGIDVSAQKEASDALRKSNERYELLNKVTNDAVYDWDLLHDDIQWGGGFYRLFGHSARAEKFAREEWARHLHPADKGPTEQSLQLQLADTMQNSWSAEYRFSRSDGTYAFVEEIGYIRRNRSGQAVRMVGVLRDVTRQKEEENELKLLGSVITNTNDAVMIAKSERGDISRLQILYVNSAFTRITGYRAAEVTGKNLMSLRGFESDENDFTRLTEAIRKVESLKAETIHFQRDDRQYYINLSIHPVLDSQGVLTHWISIGRDVTEKRMYVSEIEARNQKLQEIAWMQSHVIRAPLARMMSLIDLVKNYENTETEQEELLDHILTSAHLLDDIIRDISGKTEKI